jgi:hypothetical protein
LFVSPACSAIDNYNWIVRVLFSLFGTVTLSTYLGGKNTFILTVILIAMAAAKKVKKEVDEAAVPEGSEDANHVETLYIKLCRDCDGVEVSDIACKALENAGHGGKQLILDCTTYDSTGDIVMPGPAGDGNQTTTTLLAKQPCVRPSLTAHDKQQLLCETGLQLFCESLLGKDTSAPSKASIDADSTTEEGAALAAADAGQETANKTTTTTTTTTMALGKKLQDFRIWKGRCARGVGTEAIAQLLSQQDVPLRYLEMFQCDIEPKGMRSFGRALCAGVSGIAPVLSLLTVWNTCTVSMLNCVSLNACIVLTDVRSASDLSCCTSHRTTSHHITSHHITSHHTNRSIYLLAHLCWISIQGSGAKVL